MAASASHTAVTVWPHRAGASTNNGQECGNAMPHIQGLSRTAWLAERKVLANDDGYK
jgi:hypothetical protein